MPQNIINIDWDCYMNLPRQWPCPLYPIFTDLSHSGFTGSNIKALRPQCRRREYLQKLNFTFLCKNYWKRGAEGKEKKKKRCVFGGRGREYSEYPGPCLITAGRKTVLLELALLRVWVLGCYQMVYNHQDQVIFIWLIPKQGCCAG